MTQQVFLVIRDLGDGSSCIDVYPDSEMSYEEVCDMLSNRDTYDEYHANEGKPKIVLTLPDGFDLTTLGLGIK